MNEKMLEDKRAAQQRYLDSCTARKLTPAEAFAEASFIPVDVKVTVVKWPRLRHG